MTRLLASRMLRAWVVFAIAVAGTLTAVEPVRADPIGEIFTDFYDCSLNHVGWRFRGCGATGWSPGNGGQAGQQSGAWKSVATEPCENGGSYSFNWYRWTGSVWAWESGPYCTCC